MAKHTPGPWVLINHDEAGLYYVKAQPHPALRGFTKEVADVFAGDDESKANARLIAAAPDLLAACEMIDREWAEFWPKGPEDDGDGVVAIAPETREIWRAIRVAIAKAKGEA